MLGFTASKLAPRLKRDAQAIEAARKEVASLKAKLTLPRVDGTDVAAAMRRQEFRTYLRGLDNDTRNHLMRNWASLEPEQKQAIIEQPVALTGVLPGHREDLIRQALQETHGPAIAEIEALESGIELAERANRLARDEIRFESQASLEEFETAAEPHEKGAGAPWLKKSIEDGEEVVRVLDLQSRSWRKASAEEVDRGHYFNGWDEYNDAHGRDPAARVA